MMSSEWTFVVFSDMPFPNVWQSIFKVVLDDLGVKQIATVIGGSMGGALVLEFAYMGTDYVRSIIPIATSARYSAWGISWGEAQRQSIYCDPKYDDGYYPFNDVSSSVLGTITGFNADSHHPLASGQLACRL